jgi:hypothetical protein
VATEVQVDVEEGREIARSRRSRASNSEQVRFKPPRSEFNCIISRAELAFSMYINPLAHCPSSFSRAERHFVRRTGEPM